MASQGPRRSREVVLGVRVRRVLRKELQQVLNVALHEVVQTASLQGRREPGDQCRPSCPCRVRLTRLAAKFSNALRQPFAAPAQRMRAKVALLAP